MANALLKGFSHSKTKEEQWSGAAKMKEEKTGRRKSKLKYKYKEKYNLFFSHILWGAV